eukprot:scpid78504/ scgid3842/ 
MVNSRVRFKVTTVLILFQANLIRFYIPFLTSLRREHLKSFYRQCRTVKKSPVLPAQSPVLPAQPVDSNTDGLPWLPDGIDRNTLYRELLSAATSLKCPFTLAAVCHQNGLLDRQKQLLQDSSCHWFREFEVLALVSADVSGMTDWMAKWPMPDGMAAKITDLAKKASPSTIDAEKEPCTWTWFCKHIFALPVNNAMAERQFNLANIHLTASDSEQSKQATHLFVENILYSKQSRPTSAGKRKKITGKPLSPLNQNGSKCLCDMMSIALILQYWIAKSPHVRVHGCLQK